MNNLVSKCFGVFRNGKKSTRPDVATIRRDVDAQIGRAVTRLSER